MDCGGAWPRSSGRRPSPRSLIHQILVHYSNQVGLLDQIAAPLDVQIVQQMESGGYFFGLPRRNCIGYAPPHFFKHSLVLENILAICNRTVPWDDFVIGSTHGIQSVVELYHPVDGAAMGLVNVGIKSMKEGVASLNHVGLDESDNKVPIRMRWRNANNLHGLACQME